MYGAESRDCRHGAYHLVLGSEFAGSTAKSILKLGREDGAVAM